VIDLDVELLAKLTDDELDELEQLLKGPPSFREYVDVVTRGRFQWYKHAEVLADRLQDVADGRLDRLMVFMPPRHGKSEEVSRLFPGYYLLRHPKRHVGATSYAAELAYGFSREARANYREAGGELADDAQAVKEWKTPQGGSMFAAGVGGPLTGRGFHLGIIDDPIKNAEEAESELIRRRHREWYQTTFYTRAEPDAAIVIVLTRWHEQDLAGWLLEREPESQEAWHIINFEAIRSDDAPEFPETCTIEPDWRKPGEALCAPRYPLHRLKATEKSIGPRAWASLYQQRPRPREGQFFKFEWFKFVDAAPKVADRVRYWDIAGTDGDGDYTVGALIAATDSGWIIEDIVRGQWAPGMRDAKIRETAERDGRLVEIWLEQETGIAGSDRTKSTVQQLQGYRVRTERPTGSKTVRAEPLAAQAEVGNVSVVRNGWNTAFLDELCSFPLAAHDDQVDAVSGAFSKLALRGRAESTDFRWA